MDIHGARARLQLMADLRKARPLAERIFADKQDDWRLHPIQICPGWISLVAEMLDEILALPEHMAIGFNYIRTSDGSLDMSWRGESEGDRADCICIAARARAAHICEWCAERGRFQPLYRRVLCQTHSDLINSKPLNEIELTERLAPGRPYKRRKMLVEFVHGKATESGFTAALHTELGEHGFELDQFHYAISWLAGTAIEADLYMLNLELSIPRLDHAIARSTGARRNFPIRAAEPVIRRGAAKLGVTSEEMTDLFASVEDYDPEVRGPAFEWLMRIFDSDEGPP